MPLPLFAPYPPGDLRLKIEPTEWLACLDAWLTLAHRCLLLPAQDFTAKASTDSSLTQFLISYVKGEDGRQSSSTKTYSLRRSCFLLVHRVFTEVEHPPSLLLNWQFLVDFSSMYVGRSSLRPLIDGIWERKRLEDAASMLEHKRGLIKLLDDGQSADTAASEAALRKVVVLLKFSAQYGRFLMTGSDFLDSVVGAWSHGSASVQKKMVILLYLAFSSLVEGEKPNVSLLLDHLYSLKSSAEKQGPSKSNATILSALVSTKPFTQKLHRLIPYNDAGRAKLLISFLDSIRTTTGYRLKKHVRRKIDKGKRKAYDDPQDDRERVDIHQMSLVTEIQDLFPDLGSAFIVKLLDEYNDSEQVIAHLLDDSLPPHLKTLDHAENLYRSPEPPPVVPQTSSSPPIHDSLITDHASAFSSHSHTLPPRHNIHDNDALDTLNIRASQLHIGRKPLNGSALLSAPPTADAKAAILAALATFDSDSDERDDTYDAEDVGGTVDTSAGPPEDERDTAYDPRIDALLFPVWKRGPELFARDSATRRGERRRGLRAETGLSDEALEGWAVVLRRDPRRLRRLEARAAVEGDGRGLGQPGLEGTAWREGRGEGSEGEESGGGKGGFRGRGGASGLGRGFGRGAGRGAGTGRGRGRGDVAGPSGERDTQVARMRKDANKGSRANHNRRDQRARKVARVGFPA